MSTTTMHTSETVTLAVVGMSCGGCAASVQRALERHPGVTSASVNLARNNATVRFASGSTSPDALLETVRAAGYETALPDQTVNSAD